MAHNNTIYPLTFPGTFRDGRPPTNSNDPVTATVDILQGASDYDLWTNDPPSAIQKQTETTPKGRENNPNPAVYVWSPTDADLEIADAEGSILDETRTIEVSIWTLEDGLTEAYHRDVIRILAEYSNDNHTNTRFHHVRPTSASDSRMDAIARRTDHYIMAVQAELRRVRDV